MTQFLNTNTIFLLLNKKIIFWSITIWLFFSLYLLTLFFTYLVTLLFLEDNSNIIQLVLSVNYIVTNNLAQSPSELLVNACCFISISSVLFLVCSKLKNYTIYYIHTRDTSQQIKDFHILSVILIITSSLITIASKGIFGDSLAWLLDSFYLKMNSTPESNPSPGGGPSSGGGNGGPGGGGNNLHPLVTQNTGDSSGSDRVDDSSESDLDSGLGSSVGSGEYDISNPGSPARFSNEYYEKESGWDWESIHDELCGKSEEEKDAWFHDMEQRVRTDTLDRSVRMLKQWDTLNSLDETRQNFDKNCLICTPDSDVSMSDNQDVSSNHSDVMDETDN